MPSIPLQKQLHTQKYKWCGVSPLALKCIFFHLVQTENIWRISERSKVLIQHLE